MKILIRLRDALKADSGGCLWGFDVIILSYLHRQATANSIDPDQTSKNAASDQGLH